MSSQPPPKKKPSARRAEAHRHHGRSSGDTPLSRTLSEMPRKRVTPLDAFALARRKWLRGERLDIGLIASELGVGRATLFRWVGSREQLYGEVLSYIYARLREDAVREAEGTGTEFIINVVRGTFRRMLEAAPLRTFIEQDPEFAIRVLTSKSSRTQARTIELECDTLRAVRDRGEINPVLDIETLGYIIVRIGESFLYGDVISGVRPDMDKAVAAIRILVSAEASPDPASAPGPDCSPVCD